MHKMYKDPNTNLRWKEDKKNPHNLKLLKYMVSAGFPI